MSTDFEIETRISLPFGVEVQAPVEIELPRTAVELCQWHFEAAQADGKDAEFPDYLWDMVQIEPTFVTTDGGVVDRETGEILEDTEPNGGED